jgi:hypothetical protein
MGLFILHILGVAGAIAARLTIWSISPACSVSDRIRDRTFSPCRRMSSFRSLACGSDCASSQRGLHVLFGKGFRLERRQSSAPARPAKPRSSSELAVARAPAFESFEDLAGLIRSIQVKVYGPFPPRPVDLPRPRGDTNDPLTLSSFGHRQPRPGSSCSQFRRSNHHDEQR